MQDRMYCLTCKQLFPDYMETRVQQKTLTFGQFMYNQQRIMWDEPIKFTVDKKVCIVNCPRCNSMHTVNATEIEEDFNRGGRRYDKNTGRKRRKLYNDILLAKTFKYN